MRLHSKIFIELRRILHLLVHALAGSIGKNRIINMCLKVVIVLLEIRIGFPVVHLMGVNVLLVLVLVSDVFAVHEVRMVVISIKSFSLVERAKRCFLLLSFLNPNLAVLSILRE